MQGTPVSARARGAQGRERSSNPRRRRGAPLSKQTTMKPPETARRPTFRRAREPSLHRPARRRLSLRSSARARRTRSPPPSQPLTQESPAPPAAKRPRSPTRSRAPAEAPAMPASEDLTQPDDVPMTANRRRTDGRGAAAAAGPRRPRHREHAAPAAPAEGADCLPSVVPAVARRRREGQLPALDEAPRVGGARARRACNADKRLLEEFSNAYTGGAAMTADHMARAAVPLATLNEVCLALRDFGPERPPVSWWASLPGALAASPETAVWGRPALDAPRVDDLRDAHEVAGRLCERVLGEDPTAQPWVAAAAFVLNAGDGWRGDAAGGHGARARIVDRVLPIVDSDLHHSRVRIAATRGTHRWPLAATQAP